MGRWDGTCGISQLPIEYMETVKFCFTVLTGKNAASGVCYATDTAGPISTVYTGEYDDYGSVKSISKTRDFVHFMDMLRDKIRSGDVHIKPDSYCDSYVTNYAEAKDEDIIQAIERDRVFEVRNGEKYNIGIFIMKRSIYNATLYHQCQDAKKYYQTSIWIKDFDFKDDRFIKEIANLCRLTVGIDELRKTYSPSSGKGGQVWGYEMFESFGKAYVDEVKRMKARKESMYEEDEDE